jgi:hypothetical protein
MGVDIKSRFDGRVLYKAKGAADVREAVEAARRDGADLRYADLRDADLRYADLRGAALRGADLRDAYLRGADLRHAALRDADLRGADLRGADLGGAALRDADLRDADLGGAKGFAPERVNDLLMLLDQVGPIRAYKLVNSEYRSPIQSTGKLTYKPGDVVEAEADPAPTVQCGKGVNVATLPWCLSNWREGHRIMVVEFTRKDIAAIPVGDGKFRVSKVRVVREIDRDQINVWLGRGVD